MELIICDSRTYLYQRCLIFIEQHAAYYDSLEVLALTDIAPGEEITHDNLGD